MAKKTKKKLTLDEVREISTKKSSKKADNESLESFDDEESDYITGNEDGI